MVVSHFIKRMEASSFINSLNPFRLSPLQNAPLAQASNHTRLQTMLHTHFLPVFVNLVSVKLSIQCLTYLPTYLKERFYMVHSKTQFNHHWQEQVERQAGQASVLTTWGQWGKTWWATAPQHVRNLPWLASNLLCLLNHIPYICQDYRVRRLQSKFSNSFSFWRCSSLCAREIYIINIELT